MTFDRPKLHGDYPREQTPATVWLVCALAGAFVIQFTLELASPGGNGGLEAAMGLSGRALAEGRWWTPLTFWLLHSTSNLFHLGLVIAGLLLLGRELGSMIGAAGVFLIFALGLLGGAIWWLAANWGGSGELVGATAGVYALLALAAGAAPDRRFDVLLFFLFPVSFRLRHLAWALGAADGLAFALNDLLGRPLPFEYAASSHLGGMAAGWIAWRFLRARTPAHAGEARAAKPLEASASSPTRTPAEVRAEVDRVLDKISAHGLGALTLDERRTLDEAKHLLNGR
jgi:membrane associated rhomboid family serine protease